MNKTAKGNLSSKVFAQMEEDIYSGKLYPGMVLSEESLAEEYNVSRTPIREALKKLSSVGLVVSDEFRRTKVFELTNKEVLDMATVRNDLEQLAVSIITPEKIGRHLQPLSKLCADCMYHLSMGNRGKVLMADGEFHQALIDTAENGALSLAYQSISLRIQLLRMSQHPTTQNLIEYVNQHVEIINLLKSGENEKAKAALDKHINHDFEDIVNNKFNI